MSACHAKFTTKAIKSKHVTFTKRILTWNAEFTTKANESVTFTKRMSALHAEFTTKANESVTFTKRMSALHAEFTIKPIKFVEDTFSVQQLTSSVFALLVPL
jgi:hypothetical protein